MEHNDEDRPVSEDAALVDLEMVYAEQLQPLFLRKSSVGREDLGISDFVIDELLRVRYLAPGRDGQLNTGRTGKNSWAAF